MAKDVFRQMYDTGETADEVVGKKGLSQISDRDELESFVSRVIADNPGPVEQYRKGKKKALGFLIGQVMKATSGKANPQLVDELFRGKLE